MKAETITRREIKKPVSLRLPRSIHKSLRLHAALEDRTMEAVVADALARYFTASGASK